LETQELCKKAEDESKDYGNKNHWGYFRWSWEYYRGGLYFLHI